VEVEKKGTAQIGTNVRARGFNVGLLAGSQFESGKSCDRPNRSRLFHVALHASYAALPMVTLKISPYTNVTLTLSWTTLFMVDMREGALHEEEESNSQTKKLKSGHGPRGLRKLSLI
jgi:hypothetical protein